MATQRSVRDMDLGGLWVCLFLSVCVATCGWAPNCATAWDGAGISKKEASDEN